MLEVVGFAAAAVVFSRLELFALLFLVPIQLAWVRRGEEGGLLSSGIALGAMVVIAAIQSWQSAGSIGEIGSPAAFYLDAVVAAGLMIGLFMMNSRLVPELIRRPVRVCERAAGAIVGSLVLFVLFRAAGGSTLWQDYVAIQVAGSPELMAQVDATVGEIVALQEQLLPLVARGAATAYLAVMLGSWWFGSLIAFRTRFPLSEGNPVMQELAGYAVVRFRLPEGWVWGLIIGWSSVALSIVLELAWLSTAAWNVALVMMVFYAIQGIAIVLHLGRRRATNQSARLLLAGGLVLGLLIPGLRIVVAVGIPLLGVSEIWVSYHRFEGSEEIDEGNS